MYALILAGGKGERLRPLTDTRAKSMAEVKGKPIMWHQLSKLATAGVTDVVVLCGDVPLIRHETIQRLIDHHQENNACITLMTSTVSDPNGSGRVVRSSSGEIKEIVEQEKTNYNNLQNDIKKISLTVKSL